MNLRATLRLSLDALLRNRVRSLLTMLGVIIGVAAVIVTVAIGAGAQASIQQQINSLGSNLIVVMPGSVTVQGGARTGFGGASTLTPDDGIAIAALPGVAAVSPMVGVRSQLVSGGYNWQTQVQGVAPTYTYIRSWPMDSGAFFSQNDVASAAKVCVLGQTVVQNLFPDGSSPIGKVVMIRGVPFTVIGTLTSLGRTGMGQDQDDTALVPYTSAMQRLTGQTTYVGTLMVSAQDQQQIQNVQDEIVTLLEQRHRIVPPNPDDFSVRNLADIASAAASTATVMAVLLASVAAVSLIVGGIGIMNIMLVSVTERTREIGLRRAVGARAGSILRQFLIESVVLSTVGGLIGVVVGFLGMQGVALIAKWPVAIPLQWVLIAVLFSGVVGVFFGYYPARKASLLHPIEALRFE
ncbi:MAG TPA: ABC transporter permease [Candidatus Baltobacteraceae bacterium]|nr:ABC transporter permease [Candidatus Baltobacteraceae bacterium]